MFTNVACGQHFAQPSQFPLAHLFLAAPLSVLPTTTKTHHYYHHYHRQLAPTCEEFDVNSTWRWRARSGGDHIPSAPLRCGVRPWGTRAAWDYKSSTSLHWSGKRRRARTDRVDEDGCRFWGGVGGRRLEVGDVGGWSYVWEKRKTYPGLCGRGCWSGESEGG